jgi:hypothetical protein
MCWPAIIQAALAETPAARAVRREFRIPFYPKMNAPGSYGGGWRGSFTLGVNGEDDANRHFNGVAPACRSSTYPRR